MSQAPRLWRLARPIAAIVALLAIVAGLLAPTATAQTGGGYPPPGGPIGSISGRVVDAETGLPIQATVTLFRCDDFGCNFATSQFAFDQGQFRFENLGFPPLPAGAYYIIASAFRYDQIQTTTFLVADGENFNVGEIALPRMQAIGSISGRLINGRTGQPVTGFFPDNAGITLLHCVDATTCEPVAGTLSDFDGRFQFNGAFFFPPLVPGLYAVEVTAPFYERQRTTPVEIGRDEHRDLGDITLTPLPTIASIRGRLVDSVTGGPVVGGGEPFAGVTLYRCDQNGCLFQIGSVTVDRTGNFRITSANTDSPLLVGEYQIGAFADQYNPAMSIRFAGRADEDVNIGDIKIAPFPVRFSNTQGCQTIPTTGGTCRYSVRVTSGMTSMLDASSWSIVQAQTFPEFPSTPSTGGSSTFQPDPARSLRLKPGQSQVLSYELRVPAGAKNPTLICVTAYVSQDRTTRLFNTIGQRQLFCVFKANTGPFLRMTEQEIREMERDGRGPRRP